MPESAPPPVEGSAEHFPEFFGRRMSWKFSLGNRRAPRGGRIRSCHIKTARKNFFDLKLMSKPRADDGQN